MKDVLNSDAVDTLAQELDGAYRNASAIAQISSRYEFGIDEAYRIQRAVVQQRVNRGEKIVGVKMGFTSKPKMVQMGVSDQIIGRLTDAMLVDNGVALSLERFIHPRCEPEVAFLLKKTLAGDETLAEVRDAVGAIAPAIEIIDSRFEQFRFSLVDVIADNASSAVFVLGAWIEPAADLAGLAVELFVDGEVRQRGSSSDILDNPLHALASAARLAALQGSPLRAGDIVLAGAATQAERVLPGAAIRVRIAGLGECSFFAMQSPAN